MVICLSERITMNKNKNTIHNQKHLTLTERIYIEQELVQGSTFSSIASIIDKDPSTISKEVNRARIIEDAGYTGKCHACQNYGDCFRKSICGDWCKWRCRNCYKKNPTHVCPDFIPWNCGQLGKPPYVCNACDKYKWCPLPKALYVANKAQASYEKKWTDSRKGINMTPEELYITTSTNAFSKHAISIYHVVSVTKSVRNAPSLVKRITSRLIVTSALILILNALWKLIRILT